MIANHQIKGQHIMIQRPPPTDRWLGYKIAATQIPGVAMFVVGFLWHWPAIGPKTAMLMVAASYATSVAIGAFFGCWRIALLIAVMFFPMYVVHVLDLGTIADVAAAVSGALVGAVYFAMGGKA